MTFSLTASDKLTSTITLHVSIVRQMTHPSAASLPSPTTFAPHSSHPRFPPELFLEIFSYSNPATLAALCTTSLSFLELATPFLYESARFEDLPQATTLQTSRLSDLLPRLALESVRTLHLDVTPTIHPSCLLPNVRHLHLHATLQNHQNPGNDLVITGCIAPLLSLNPTTLTFHFENPRRCDVHHFAMFEQWIDLADWNACTTAWNSLLAVTLAQGSPLFYDRTGSSVSFFLSSDVRETPCGPRPMILTYDVRGMKLDEYMEGWEYYGARCWPGRMLQDGVFALECLQGSSVRVKAESEEQARWIDAKLREETLEHEHNPQGFDCRARVEIVVEPLDE
jgi:hypothetical protein